MCFPTAMAWLRSFGRKPVEAESKYTVSSLFANAVFRSVDQRVTPLARARSLSLSALRPTRIGSGITRRPSARRTPPSARMAQIERMRCWLVPIRPVTPFMMIPSRIVSTVVLLRIGFGCSAGSRRGRQGVAERLERRPVGLRCRSEARRLERGNIDKTVANRQPDAAAAPLVQPGLRGEKGLLFRVACALSGESVDVVVAVALGVLQAEQRRERQVLLNAKSRLHGQILARQEIARRDAVIPLRTARRVEQRLVDSLAALARYSGVAGCARARKCVEGRVGFVDEKWLRLRKRRYVGVEGDRARQRLLQIQRRREQPCQRRRRFDLAPELGDSRRVGILFVTVEGDRVAR